MAGGGASASRIGAAGAFEREEFRGEACGSSSDGQREGYPVCGDVADRDEIAEGLIIRAASLQKLWGVLGHRW